MIFFLGFLILSLEAAEKKEFASFESVNLQNIPLKGLQHKILNNDIHIDNDSLDLVFDYKLYKKLLVDNILDDLILDAGFEPNSENRMIFFSAISKDLQKKITNVLSPIIKNDDYQFYNSTVSPYDSMQYKNMQYQTEMARSMATLAQTAISTIKQPENKRKYGLAFGGFMVLLMAEFGFFGKVLKISNWFLNVKDKINNVTGTVSTKSKGFFYNTWENIVEKTFLKNIIYRDFTKGDPVAENFIENYEQFEQTIKDDKEIIKLLGKCNKIMLCDKKGKALLCPNCVGPDDLYWRIRDFSKK